MSEFGAMFLAEVVIRDRKILYDKRFKHGYDIYRHIEGTRLFQDF